MGLWRFGLVVAALATTVVNAAAAQTADPGFYRNTYVARTAVNGLCLDASGGRMQPGDTLIIWPCHGGANQRLYPVPANPSDIGRSGAQLVVGGRDGRLCLESPSSPGSRPYLAVCNDSTRRQFWRQDRSGRSIVNESSSLCLDVEGGRGEQGTAVLTSPCHGRTNQLWTFERP